VTHVSAMTHEFTVTHVSAVTHEFTVTHEFAVTHVSAMTHVSAVTHEFAVTQGAQTIHTRKTNNWRNYEAPWRRLLGLGSLDAALSWASKRLDAAPSTHSYQASKL
jgi:hypothetical protein